MKHSLVARLIVMSAAFSAGSALANPTSDLGATSNLVLTDADSLLDFAAGQGLESRNVNEDVREFLTCFVSNMDLPAQVYADCAIKVVQAGVACQGGALNETCIAAAVQVAQKCALPVKRAIDGAKTCWAEGKAND